MPLKNNWVNGDLFTPAAANDMANAVNASTNSYFKVTDYGATGNNNSYFLTLTGPPTSGGYTLSYNGFTTTSIAHNATATTIQTRLALLTGIGTVTVTATGTTGKFTVAISNFTSVLTVGTSTLVGGSVATTTIDTAGIHDARDAAGDGGTVFFPPGTYLVSGLTASVANQTWELAAGATVKAATGAANILAITADDVTVTGGVFDGVNQAPASDWARKGIFVNAADGVTVRNVEIVDSPSHGVYGSNCNKLTVADCRIIEHNQGAVLVQNGEANTTKYDIVMTGNYAESSIDGAQGLGVLGGVAVETTNMFVERVNITNNTVILLIDPALETACIGLVNCIQSVVSDNITVGSYLGITFPKAIKAVISDNQIRKFSGAGIEIPGNITDCVVSGNVIDAVGVTSTAYGSALVGIWNSGVGGAVVKSLSIVGNAISGMDGDMTGIALGFGTSTESVAITGNVIRGGTCNRYIGVGIVGLTKNVTISGNTFDAGTVTTAVRGIEFRNGGSDTTSTVSDVAVSNNIFTSTSTGSSAAYSISFTNAVTGLAVTGNVFKAPSSAGYAALSSNLSASNVTFTGNSVNGATSTFTSGIEIYGAVNGMTVAGNQLTNLNQAVVRLLTSTAVTVQNVTVGGNNLVNVANRITNATSGSAVVASSVITTDNDSTATLTNKSIALGSNTITGTLAEFNTAVTDANLARTDAANTFTGVQTMTSPAITTPTGIVKGDVGLGNVDNTTDANKPISTATQTALNTVSYYGWPGGNSGDDVVFGGTNATITSPTEGFLVFTPFWLPAAKSISRIAVTVPTAGSAGSVVRIGAYNDDNGVPGTLIFDAGTVNSTTTGDKEITTSQTLPAGRFWLAAVVQGGASTLARLGGVTQTSTWNLNAFLSPYLDAVYWAYFKASVSGALPDPAFTSRAAGIGQNTNIGYAFRVRLA